MPVRKTLADGASTPPVKVAAGALIVPVEPLDVMDELRAAQVSEVLPPKKTPTVCASVICIIWITPAAKVAFVAQKLMVELNAVVAPSHTGVAVVPS